MLTGSLGMLPSASLGNSGTALYEPVTWLAVYIAGQGVANPIATIASLTMMLRHSLGLADEADKLGRRDQPGPARRDLHRRWRVL